MTLFDFKKGFPNLKSLLPEFDIVFPVMHGHEGEDGTLYNFLRSNRKIYVGSDPKGARVAFDKILFKKYCKKKRSLRLLGELLKILKLSSVSDSHAS